MAKVACLFPGQGSQSVGMGKDLFDSFEQARLQFEHIDSIAGRPLSQLCFEGPEDQLKRTINTQPTILAVSLAAWSCYQSLGGPEPDYVAGHSLGEISALVAAKSLVLDDAVRLVEKRAHFMEECPKGAMSAVIGLSSEVLEECARQAQADLRSQGASDDQSVVVVANFNTREQLVLSGNPDAVAKAGENAKSKGGKAIPLAVGGAFHSPLMVAASRQFAAQLETATFKDGEFWVVQNYDAKATKAAAELKAKLSKQMESAVRWCASVEAMVANGVDTFVEIGPGKVLTGTVKKIDKNARVFNIFDRASLEATLKELNNAVLA